MKEKIRILYVGYHSETLLLLCGDTRFDVIGVGLIDEFLSGGTSTTNPVNAFFKLIYGLRCGNKYRLLERILLRLWKLISRFSSSFYYRYSDYLKALSEARREVVDVSNTSAIIDFIQLNRIDLMVVSAWSILPDEIVTLPKYGTINIHPSKLPQYRGALPTLWSLKNNDTESAVTYLMMDKVIDGGAIIGQHAFPIGSDDDCYSLEDKVNEILRATLLSDLERYVAGEIKPVAQDMHISSNTDKYYEYMKIDWGTENGTAIYNKINLYPFLVPEDYCYTLLNGRKIIIKKAVCIDIPATSAQSGQYHVHGRTLMIQAKSGVIASRLFSGIRFKESIFLFLRRKGNFI